MNNDTIKKTPKLEDAAQALAAETGCPIEVARTGIRMELARCMVGIGGMTIAQANKYLADCGIKAKIVRK
jgi:hypothetical protein